MTKSTKGNLIKIAVVHWSKEHWDGVKDPQQIRQSIINGLQKAKQEECELIVFPAFTGAVYDSMVRVSGHFLEFILKISTQYSFFICPGSYLEMDKDKLYHTSLIINSGEIVLKQRQLYLSKWEKAFGLSRGSDIETFDVHGLKTAIILSTDCFYPQVSRRAALLGVKLVLSPVGILGSRNPAVQISGMWQQVQQNMFFGIDCGFNGTFNGRSFWADSIVYAPLSATPDESGIIEKASRGNEIITSLLDYRSVEMAKCGFDPLRQLNPQFYRTAGLFSNEE
jgi:predicted amidohydrolase